MREDSGPPVGVDNRPGAHHIGAQAAAQAEPDCYTLFMGDPIRRW